MRKPGGPWVRDDNGFYEGSSVPSSYDPLISKLSVWAPDRAQALAKMRRALGEYVITGIKSNLTFHEKLLVHPEFAAGRYHTGFIQEHAKELLGYHDVPVEQQAVLAAAIAIAASRAERHSAHAEGIEAQSAAGLSPWIAAHRQKQLG
jgi:acetyl-CoA carboxylase biotin carboxylase subunit